MSRFLIVDDSAIARKMIIAALRPLNAEFDEAATGLEAIEKLAVKPYDLVTLDLNMPDMHGLEFLHFIRSHSRLNRLPVMVITTRDDEAIEQTVLSDGANRFLRKPFTPQEILESVEALLERKQSQA